MSGHSKWSTIKRAKGAADAKRGMTFTKLGNLITQAAKQGGSGDIDSNPRLRIAVETARGVNMPKENIQRAIDKGLGKLPGQTLEEVFYEGYGPAKVAYIVEGLTDNKLRTLAEVKNLFDRSGGAMATQGSVSFMFDKKGEIIAQSKNPTNKDEELLELIDLGVLDVEDFDDEGVQKYLIYTEVADLNSLSNKITQQGFKVESAEIVYKPTTTVEITDKEQAEKVLGLADRFENHDDIQKVYSNFDIPESLLSN